MPDISVLIKPSSGNCNLACKYCFYADVISNRETQSYGMMTFETLDALVRRVFEYADHLCSFSFQGGEPTLVGLDFYKQLIKLQTKYNKKGVTISNSIQTNGMLIDDDWALFLGENRFLVGLSLDGNRDCNDFYRVDKKGEGTFARVLKTAERLTKHNVDFNILSVVTGLSASHGTKTIREFLKHGFNYLQFIPCLEGLECDRTMPHSFGLTPAKYASFLKSTFDEYFDNYMNGCPLSIRQFDNYINMLLNYPPESCGMSGMCTCYFVIEGDGTVFPCDFYVIDEYRLGNVTTDSFADMLQTKTATRFVCDSKQVDEKCQACKWFRICRGGCKRYREPFEDGKLQLNYYCESYNEFFEYAYERLVKIATDVHNRYFRTT